jgi:5-methylcytosine-specific restriction enzyme A
VGKSGHHYSAPTGARRSPPKCVGHCGRRVVYGDRCPDCQRTRDKVKAVRRPDLHNDAKERERRRRVVADHRVLVGDWCPGWERRPAHPSADLTADHIREVARGGDPYGPLVVRCRSCNAARSARVLSRLLGPDPSPAEVSDTLRTQPPPVVG